MISFIYPCSNYKHNATKKIICEKEIDLDTDSLYYLLFFSELSTSLNLLLMVCAIKRSMREKCTYLSIDLLIYCAGYAF